MVIIESYFEPQKNILDNSRAREDSVCQEVNPWWWQRTQE